MGKNDSKLEKSFIDKIGKITKQWGLGESTGRVWGTLLFSDVSLSQREIAKKSEYSLSLVSPCLKILEKLNMVKSIRGNGKEKVYELVGSFIDAFNSLVKRVSAQEIKPLITQLEEGSKIADEKKKNKIQRLVKEYKSLEMYLNLFSKILSMKQTAAKKIGKLIG